MAQNMKMYNNCIVSGIDTNYVMLYNVIQL